jgi:hypothetical protein
MSQKPKLNLQMKVLVKEQSMAYGANKLKLQNKIYWDLKTREIFFSKMPLNRNGWKIKFGQQCLQITYTYV